MEELAKFLKNNYGMSPDKIKDVMAISLEARKRMRYKVIGKAV